MPNHCENVLMAFKKFKDGRLMLVEIPDRYTHDEVENENQAPCISLKKIIKRPAILEKITTGSTLIDGVKHHQWVDEEQPDASFKARPLNARERKALEATGHDGFHSWSLANWGTKWDTYDGQIDGKVHRFLTAWGPPEQAILKLSEKVPGLIFYLGYAEPGANFSGCGVFLSGEVLTTSSEDYSEDSNFLCEGFALGLAGQILKRKGQPA